MPEIPSDLQPTVAREPAQIELVSQDVATQVPAEAMKEVAEGLDLVALNGNIMCKLGELGVQVGSIGSVQVGRGFNFVTSKKVLEIIFRLSAVVETDPARAIEAARAVGYLAGQISKLTGSMKDKAATSTAAPAPGPTRTKSFPSEIPVIIKDSNVLIQKEA